ncbi:MAG: 2-succinyl-6-hydroxy-2,4-cyclohexadiene-1-carboxylate synthase [Candidatus Marinamargulisbacteria bacterium]|jgi:2-succinyl-6-hydroxy-2,4-cyclohexadiene-1-carboxylate synthase
MIDLNYQWDSKDTNKTTLLFLHGFLGNHREWKPLTDLLKEQFNCLSIDLPGHGKSNCLPEDYSFPRISESITRLFDELQIDKAICIGYSLGGRIALDLALTYPDRVHRLVLESASLGIEDETERKKRRAKDERWINLIGMTSFSEFLTKWYQQPLFISLRKSDAFEKVMQFRVQNDPKKLKFILRDLSPGVAPAMWNQITNLRPPCLFITGENDIKYKAMAKDIQTRNASIALSFVSEAGHNCHLEQPQAFLASVRPFLEPVILDS